MQNKCFFVHEKNLKKKRDGKKSTVTNIAVSKIIPLQLHNWLLTHNLKDFLK